MNLHFSALFRHRLGFVRRGERYLVTPWRANLISDVGLDKVGTLAWAGCFNAAFFGAAPSPVPVRRDTGLTTVSQSGNTLTASAGFFVPTDTARLFKFDTGAEVYITAYTSNTQVTCSGAPATVPASPGTIWYVNETALTSVLTSTTTYGTNLNDNGSTVLGNAVTMKRTFIAAALGAPAVIREMGFSYQDGVNIFDRDVLPAGVPMQTGDQPLAVCELVLTVTPNASTPVPNVGTGCDTSGNAVLSGVAINAPAVAGLSFVNTSGGWDSTRCWLDAQQDTWLAVLATAPAFPPFSMGAGPNLNAHGAVLATTGIKENYTLGTYYRDKKSIWSVAAANGFPIVAVILPLAISGNNTSSFYQSFTNPFTKNSSQVLEIVFRNSWSRVLVN